MNCFAGLCSSQDEQDASQKNMAINKDLKRYRKSFENQLRLLLLGAGESGKSTIVKQMRVIYSTGFSTKEREQMKKPIYSNICNSIKTMIEFIEQADIPLEDSQLIEDTEWMTNNVAEDGSVTAENSEFFDRAERLWHSDVIQEAYRRANEYQLLDSTKYFFDDIERIRKLDYLPSDQDMLQARIITTGIFETKFIVKGATFHMFDVGGQRSERRKWIQCFADVTGIIYIVATSAYNQYLREDTSQNRLVESLELFTSIWKNRWLSQVSVVLFLNKCDLLKEKIEVSDMGDYFDDYDGGCDYENAKGFIRSKFLAIGIATETRRLYPHFTIATDTANIKRVFTDVKDIILHFHLAEFGLV
ncbi:hypothetical protein SARC_07701 [Sphaeroforma arctica JP610]|uniref:Adenylate cyclase-stimulating G alpha protein n=1 Tax=Sphaeroforma arctica JP610 TaxID=667725 RepID=A0A0L0FTM1_9EUKA|nr:hypothetical protein SARC_07701 [Sphaeroforma arctica JP610]KNC79921.1 hypothetical protein SARC_07701 [Sphaeroforma arctica JP610]|eukprot:XP_014153823.1 hypothetical protein SARC_07701 [Sphaeroforma arctica JP610]